MTATLKRDVVDDTDVGVDDSTMLIVRSGCRKAVSAMVTCFVSNLMCVLPDIDGKQPIRRWRLRAAVKRAIISTCLKHGRTTRPTTPKRPCLQIATKFPAAYLHTITWLVGVLWLLSIRQSVIYHLHCAMASKTWLASAC